jgi:hypothetical protein
MPQMAVGVLVVFLLAAVVVSWIWAVHRSREILDRWAAEHGFELLEVERRHLFRGPFFWRTGKGHQVFRVSVADERGIVRHGYVRVGGWWGGLFSDQAVVAWD